MYTWAGVQGSTLPPHPHAYNPTPSGVGGWVGGCPPPPVGSCGWWWRLLGGCSRNSPQKVQEKHASMHACTHARMYACMHA